MTGIAFTPLVPVWLIVVLGVIALALIVYGYARKARGALIRGLPIAALVLAVADPELVTETHNPLKDIAVVVVDDSDSQQLGPRQERTEKALEKLSAELADAADLEVRTVRAGHPDAAAAHQDGTRLFAAVTAAMSDIPASRLAGTVLITDGQVHDALPPERARQVHAPYLSAPLHMLITGDRNEYDRRIRVESAPDFGIVGQTISIKLRVDDTAAPAGTTVPITLRRNGGIPQEAMLATGKTAEVPVPIENSGPNVFEISVLEGRNELSTENNHTMVAINGIRDRLKVLLVSGQPHVGERAWRNLLKSDPNVDLVHFTILRPLNKDDGTPLNELSLIAFPIRELFEEQLKDFDLIIFDRYSQRGLIPTQYMANVANYVQQGGAVMLAVGPEYSDSFSLFGGPLQGVLPAEPSGRVYSGAFRPRLSDVGHRHPVTAALEGANGTESGSEPTWGRWLRQIQVAKPNGTKVMLGQQDEPLLILNRVGKGRVALMLSDTIWLWGKGFDGGGPQVELMRRVAHWLMKEPELEEEALSAEVQNGGLAIARHSLSAAEVPVTVKPPNGPEQSITPKDTGAGKFAARLPITEPGLYRLTDGKNTALAAVGSPNPLESYDVVATAERVGPVAEATGGGVYWLQDGAVPAIRRTTPGRAGHGSTWMGLKANKQFVVTGVTQTPLAPVGLILLLVMAGAMLAWWREGR